MAITITLCPASSQLLLATSTMSHDRHRGLPLHASPRIYWGFMVLGLPYIGWITAPFLLMPAVPIFEGSAIAIVTAGPAQRSFLLDFAQHHFFCIIPRIPCTKLLTCVSVCVFCLCFCLSVFISVCLFAIRLSVFSICCLC